MTTIGEEVMVLTVARADDLPEDATRARVYSLRESPRVYVYLARDCLLGVVYGWLPLFVLSFAYASVEPIVKKVVRLTMARADDHQEHATRAFVYSP